MGKLNNKKDMAVQYLTDESGNKKAVLIPIEEWQLFKQEWKEWHEYQAMKAALKSAFFEVKQIQSGQLPKRTLKAFLDEI